MTGNIPLGLSVHAYQPIIVPGAGGSYTPRGMFLGSIEGKLEAYSHTIEAFGGYTTASFTFKASEAEIDDWLENGLNRHIEVYDPRGIECWEGFVNQLTYSVGGFSVVRGPLMDLANRVWCTFASLDSTATPPTQGLTTETPLANNLASQERYGLLERIIDAGTRDEINNGEASHIRDTYMAEQRVLTNKTWNSTGMNEPTLTVDCCGYIKRLERLYFIDAVNATITCTQEVTNVLDADLLLNHLFSSTNASIGVNAVGIGEYRSEYVPCDTVLKDAVSFGGPAYARWLFYIGNGRYATYRAVTDTIAYIQTLREPSQSILNPFGDSVHPINVWPGQWMFFPDFAIGRKFDNNAADLASDPRALFIESATFTAPDQLDIAGGKSDRLPQILKEYGIGGI